jgi:hypothetical protein
MSKSEIARRLHQMVDERLFGNKPWPMGQESAKDAHATLLELGLIEYVSATDYRDTTLGKELDVSLLQAFMGLWDEYELPDILEMRSLIEEKDVSILRKVLSRGHGWEQIFKEYVRKAYFAYHNPSLSLN